MAEETKNITSISQSPDVQSDLSQVSALPSHITSILSGTNSGVSDIVRIKELEEKETWLFSWIYYWVINRFNDTLWITTDPSVFAEMTDTLNKHRKILEMKASDNYTSEMKEAA